MKVKNLVVGQAYRYKEDDSDYVVEYAGIIPEGKLYAGLYDFESTSTKGKAGIICDKKEVEKYLSE